MMTIDGTTTVRDLLAVHPEGFGVFLSRGMCEDCKAAPPPVPLHHFSTKHEVPLDQLISELSSAISS